MSKTIAILGAGNIAQHHLDAYRLLGITNFEVASSQNSKSIDAFCKKNNINTSYKDPLNLVKSKKWDAIIIATPTSNAISYLSLLKADYRKILVEKPVALESQKLIEFMDRDNIVVGYNRRFYDTSSYALSFLKNKSSFYVDVSIPESAFKKLGWSKNLPYYVYENSTHVFDLLHFLLGKITIDKIEGKYIDKNFSAIFANCIDQNFNKIYIRMNFDAPENFAIKIVTDSEILELRPLEILEHFYGMRVVEPTNSNPIRLYKPICLERVIEKTDLNLKPGFLAQSKQFLKFLDNNDKGIFASLQDAYIALKFVESINNSIGINR